MMFRARTVVRAATTVVLPVATSGFATTPTLAVAAPTMTAAVRWYGRGASQKGDKVRLTAKEREAKRNRTPEMKRAAREAEDAAEIFVGQDFPDDVAAVTERYVGDARNAVTKLTNPVVALEREEIDIAGVKRPLVQLGSLVKTKPGELTLMPHDTQHLSILLNKLARLDHTLNPLKREDKLVLTIDPVTRERREATAAEIEEKRSELKNKSRDLRRFGEEHIRDLKLTNRDLESAFCGQIADVVEEKIEAALEEMDAAREEVLSAQDDEVDEVDAKDNV